MTNECLKLLLKTGTCSLYLLLKTLDFLNLVFTKVYLSKVNKPFAKPHVFETASNNSKLF